MFSALGGLYLFTPDRRMSNGFCSVTINRATPLLHTGNWTCAGRLVGRFEESFDVILVNVARNQKPLFCKFKWPLNKFAFSS